MKCVIVENKEQFNDLCKKRHSPQYVEEILGSFGEYTQKCRKHFSPRKIIDNRLAIDINNVGFGFCDVGYFIGRGWEILNYSDWCENVTINPKRFLRRHTL